MSLNDRILKDQPNDADALARQGEFALQNGETAKAIASLEALLRRVPNHPRGHYNLGRALFAAKQVEAARVQFTEAIRSAPDFVPARVALAKVQIGTECNMARQSCQPTAFWQSIPGTAKPGRYVRWR